MRFLPLIVQLFSRSAIPRAWRVWAGAGLLLSLDSIVTIWVASSIGALAAVAISGIVGILGAGLFSTRLIVLRTQIKGHLSEGSSDKHESDKHEIEHYAGLFFLTGLAALPGLATTALSLLLYPPFFCRHVGKIILGREDSALEILRQHIAGE